MSLIMAPLSVETRILVKVLLGPGGKPLASLESEPIRRADG